MASRPVPEWHTHHWERIETPCYVYEESALRDDVRQLRELLPVGASPLYSLKANPQPWIAAYLSSLGVQPEVASEGEYDACLGAGIDPKEILVGGVAKGERYLQRVASLGSRAVTVDSLAELERLRGLKDAAGVRVLLRVNPGIAIGGLDMGGNSQFGLAVEDALEVIRSGQLGSMQFYGLHFYFGSQRLKVAPIVKTLRIVADILNQFRDASYSVPRVDVGLGCGVPYLDRDHALDHPELKRELQAIWSDTCWRGMEVWSEAGRSLVGRAGTFVSTVLERKRLNGRTYYLTDGGLNAHNPGFGLGRLLKSNPQFIFAKRNGDSGSLDSADLCGSLCTSADRIGVDVPTPKLEPGDRILIPNSGAYCQTTAMWGFNSQRCFSEAVLRVSGEFVPLSPQYSSILCSSI